MKKFAIIGCGGIGSYHLGHLMAYEDIEIVGMCDVLLPRAEGFAQKTREGKAFAENCKAFADYREMFDEAKPDAVFICIPPNAHGVIEFEAIQRGIHLFVEKPMTNDLALAKRISAAIEEKGLVSAVGLQCRYDNINESAREFIAANQIVAIQGSRVGGLYVGPDWWRVRSASCGMLAESAIHQMDMIRYLLGVEPVEVFTMGRRGVLTNDDCVGYDLDDVSVTTIRFADGTVGTMTAGCYSTNAASFDSKLTFSARDRRAEYVLCRKTSLFGVEPETEAAEDAEVIKGDGAQRRSENEKGIVTKSEVDFGLVCDRAFVDGVITGDTSKIRSPYADALRSLAFVLACNQSMDTGLPVKIQL